MTGPEHYREAERLIAASVDSNGNPPADDFAAGTIARQLAAAQVHATLALTAAVAESGGLADVGTLGVPSPWGRALDGGA